VSKSERSAYFKEQAEKCLRHADAVGDTQTKEALRKLAEEYAERASDFESQEKL
jgi:hypothetical protein